MNRPWSDWMFRLFKSANSKKTTRRARTAPRLGVEHLEDRVVPAITILDTGIGTLDGSLSASDGTITAAESTGAQTLSRTALEGVGPTITISISSDAITFNNLSSTLTLQTSPGTTATFDSGAGALTFGDVTDTLATSGGSLNLTAGGNMTIGSLSTSNGNIVLSSGGTFMSTGSIVGAATNITGANGVTVQTVIGTSVTIVSSAGSITSDPAAPSTLIQASAQLTTTAATGINIRTLANQFAATNSTSGNITVAQATPTSASQTLTIVGDVNNAVAGGLISITNNSEAIVVNSGVNVTSNNGAITLSATDLTLNGTINSGTAVTTLSTSAAGTQIDLGTNTTGKFSLTQAELNTVTASNLRIGSSTSGAFMVTAAITAQASFGNTLTLISGAAMTDTAAGSITATNLRLSGTGPITLDSANNVTNLVADLVAATPSGALVFSNGTNPLVVSLAAIDTVSGITTNNSDVTLVADSLNVLGLIDTATGNANAGGAVSFVPFTAATNITVGGGATGLGISDTELGQITASAVRIGAVTGTASFPATTGTILVDGNINRRGGGATATGFDTLHFRTANTTATAVTQNAGTFVSATMFAVESVGTVTLDSATNDFDFLAGSVTGTTPDFLILTEAGGVQIAVVDGVSGLSVSAGNAGNRITLSSTGPVTQATGANVTGPQFEFTGAGPVTLTNTGNDVDLLAAVLTGANNAFSYTDADDLSIDTVNATTGISTNNGNISVNTVNGALTVQDTAAAIDVNAGTASVSLTAGDPNATDPDLTISANAVVAGTGGITLVGDNIVIGAGASVNAGGGIASLRPFANGTLIDLGGADGTNTLGLTDAELDTITAGVIRVGFANAGNLSVSANIDPAGTNTLHLITGGAIVDNNAGAFDLQVTNLALEARNGIADGQTTPAAGGNVLDIIVTTVAASNTTSGSIVIANPTTALTVGTVDGVVGVNNAATASLVDSFVQASAGTLTISSPVTTAGDNLRLFALGATSDVLVNAAVSVTAGSGFVLISAENNVSVAAPVSTVGSGAITITADNNGNGVGDVTSTATGTVSSAGGVITISGVNATVGGAVSSTGGGNILLTATIANLAVNAAVSATGGNGSVALSAGDNISVTAPISVANAGVITANADTPNGGVGDFTNSGTGTLTTAGGNVTIRAQDIDIGAAISTTTAATSNVILLTRDPADVIDLGTDTGFGLTDADLDNVTTGVLRVGSTATNTGGITITSQITQPGTPGYRTLSLETGGAITDNTAGEQTDLTVDNLALRANTGIGAADDIDIQALRLAFNNSTSGNVQISNIASGTNALTIDSVAGFTTSANSGSSATTMVTTTRGLVFNVNTSSDGTATFMTTGVSDAPNFIDDITVNSGVTVAVIGVGQNLSLIAADDIVINTGATVNAANILTLTAGDADADGGGQLFINGTINGNIINLTAYQDILLPFLNKPTSAINVTSINGAIIDPDTGAVDDIDITAASITFTANTGIGVGGTATDTNIETQTPAFEAQTVTGGILIDNGVTTPVTLVIGGLSGALNGVQATTSGNITINNAGSIQALTSGDIIRSANGNVTLNATGTTADVTIATGDSPAVQAAGAGSTVTIMAGQDIFLGSPGGSQGDVAATNVTLTAGRDITLNADSDVSAAGGSVNVTAGRNVSLIQTGGVGSSISTTGPVINITTGANGIFTLNSGTGGTISTTNQPINITADDVVIVAPATITAGTGVITIKQVTGTRVIDLGTNTAGTLGLTDVEIDQISTTGRLQLGVTANTGNINVTAAIDGANIATLHLQTGGAIVDTGPGSITETNLALEASTGVASSGTPLDTSVSNLEAQTATGGIFIANTGTVLNVGGVLATLNGVQATTSGNISITNNNTINVTGASTENIVTQSGNILVNATGATSDVQTGTAPVAPRGTIRSASGNVTVMAGQDILLGRAGAVWGDVIANGDITLTAGRDITVDHQTVVLATATGTITGTAGRNISVLRTSGGNPAEIVTEGGTITLTTGPNGLLTLDSDNGGGTVRTTNGGGNGNITFNADRANITSGDTVTAGTAIVTIQQVSPAWNIDLGSATDAAANTLELSDAEFDRITAGIIRVGDPTNTGNITVTSAISPAGTTVLALRTAGTIADGTGTEQADLIVANLQLRAGTGTGTAGTGDIDVDVTTLAALNTTSGDIFVSDVSDLSVGTVDGTTGVTNAAAGGAVVLEAGFGGTGALVVTDTAASIDVQATFGGIIILRANDAVTVNSNAVVQSGTGNISVLSNFGDLNGTSGITLQSGSFIKTEGDILLDANPDGNTLGGGITVTSYNQLAGTGAGVGSPANAAQNVTLRAGASDLTIDDLFADNDISITTRTNILDDSVDTTRARAGRDILLSAGGLIGGVVATPTPISTADILSASTATPAANFLAALDVAYGRNLSLTQTNTLGNIQVRKIESGLATSSVIQNGTLVNSGNQLALISSGGNLTVDSAFTVNNGNLLLATTGGNSITINTASGVTNTDPNATTNLMASGSTTASITGSPANVIAEVSGTSIGLFTSGGNIGTMANALKINSDATTGRLDGFTNGAVNNVANTGGDAFLTDTQNGVRVGLFNAGTAGDVTLVSQGNITPTGSSIVAVTHNDNVAEIIGDVITLNATATSTGAGGQIGLPATFFEVNANTLNASTNNSALWISEVGTGAAAGAAVGLVTLGTTTGTTTAFLRVRNGGTLTSAALDGVADVLAPVVNLSTVAGDTPAGGNFGTGTASPLEIDAATLNSNLAGGGNLFVRDTTAGLTVQRANTTTGNIGIEVTGAGNNLVLGNASSAATVVSTGGTTAGTATATLTATGAITSAAPAGIMDVAALLLGATAGTGIGTSGTPLETTIGTLAASGGTGGVFLTNTGALTVGTVGAQNGVSATGAANIALTTVDAAGAGQDLTVAAGVAVATGANGNVTLQSGDNLTVNGTITTSGTGITTLVGDFADADTGTGTVMTVSATGVLNSATPVQITGGADADSFNLTPQTGAALSVTGGNPTTFPGDTLQLINLTGATPVTLTPGATGAGTFTFGGGRQQIAFTGIENASTAVVTIAPATLTVAEPVAGSAPAAATFTLTRVGDTSSALTVNFTIGGTAANGVDYQTLGGTATFAAGSATATVTVNVVGDTVVDPAETVTITLTTAPGYTVGATGAAALTITDTPTPPPPPAPPFYTNAAVVGTNLFLTGAGVPGGSQIIGVPLGSFAVFADVTGDGFGDVILGLPNLLLVVDGLTGRFLALFVDINGDNIRDGLIFNGDGTTTVTDGRTGRRI